MRLPVILKYLLVLVILTGACASLFRIQLVDAVLNHQLSALGVPDHSFQVDEVSLSRVVLRDFSLGSSHEFQSESISASWSMQSVLAGGIRLVEIEGLRLLVDLTNEKPLLGSLQGLLDEGGKGASKPAPSGSAKIPKITLSNARVELVTDSGDAQITVDGIIQQGDSDQKLIDLSFESSGTHKQFKGQAKGQIDAVLESEDSAHGHLNIAEGGLNSPEISIADLKGETTFQLVENRLGELITDLALAGIVLQRETPSSVTIENADVALHLDGSDATLSATLSASDQSLLVTLESRISDYLRQPTFSVDLKGDLHSSSTNLALSNFPLPDSGSATFSAKVEGSTPPFSDANGQWLRWLQASELKGESKFLLQELAYEHKVSDLSGELDINAEFAGGIGKLVLNETSGMNASGLNADWLQQLGIPKELTSLTKSGTSVQLVTKDENVGHLKVDSESDHLLVDSKIALAIATNDAGVDIQASGRAELDKQLQLSTFNVDEFNLVSTGITYENNTYDHLKLSGHITGTKDNLSGLVDVSADAKRVRYETYDARRVKVKFPIKFEFNKPRWTFLLHKPGQLAAGLFSGIDSVGVKGPLTLRFPKAQLGLTPEIDSIALSHKITVNPKTFTLLVEREGDKPIEAKIRSGRIRLSGELTKDGAYKGESIFNNARVTLPQYEIELKQISTKIPINTSSDSLRTRFSIGEISHLAEQPYFAPMTLAGQVKLIGNNITVNAVGGAADLDNLKLNVVHSLRSGKGHLKVQSDPLSFRPGGLQPAALMPDLAVLEEVMGEATTEAQLSWTKNGLTSDAQLGLGGWSFDMGGARVSGLVAGLEMTDIVTPRSAPRQTISIARIDAGVPLELFEAVYDIRGGDSPKVAIDVAQVDVLGGMLNIKPAIIDPLASRTEFELQVNGLDLGRLFELIQVEGLAGSGRLDGLIPVGFEGDQVSITDGQLSAREPGILRLHSESLSQVLGGRVENVDMLIEALTEFHYSELTLTLNNSTNNDMVVKLSLLGNNPRVMSGQRFRLNINLESNISKILEALAQGYGLSNQALQRALRLR